MADRKGLATHRDAVGSDPAADAGEPGQEAGSPRAAAGERPERGSAAGAGRSRGAISAREILVAAARAGRRDVWRILAVSVAVSTASALADVIVDHFVDPTNVPLSVLAGVSAGGVSILGTVLLSGFLCRLAGAADHRGQRVTLGEVARTLPWGRLVLADLLVTLLVVIGLIALVIPGLVILNLLAVAGPVIEIEDRRVLAALRRSAQLVRRHFWSVALVATLPVLVAVPVESAGPEPASVGAILEVLVIRGVAGALLEAAIGLILVELCYRLIGLATSPPPAGPPPAGPPRR